MKWSDSLATGATEIDIQHQELINRVNGVLEACKQRKGRERIAEALQLLQQYVEEHFTAEEELQETYEYPMYNQHRLLHRQFIVELHELRCRFENEGTSLTVTMKLNQLCVGWLIEHILKADKAFARHLRKRVGNPRLGCTIPHFLRGL